jgi:hypothetical protein
MEEKKKEKKEKKYLCPLCQKEADKLYTYREGIEYRSACNDCLFEPVEEKK